MQLMRDLAQEICGHEDNIVSRERGSEMLWDLRRSDLSDVINFFGTGFYKITGRKESKIKPPLAANLRIEPKRAPADRAWKQARY